jgi:hypothetical protein
MKLSSFSDWKEEGGFGHPFLFQQSYKERSRPACKCFLRQKNSS